MMVALQTLKHGQRFTVEGRTGVVVVESSPHGGGIALLEGGKFTYTPTVYFEGAGCFTMRGDTLVEPE